MFEAPTFRSITARAVVVKLKRPLKVKLFTIPDWPVILIDLHTEEGITGRAYLGPYNIATARYLVAMLEDFTALFKGKRLAPVEFFETARKSLHFVGYEGLSLIAVSGLDMAAWDAVARAANVPLCVLLGGAVGPLKAYNSNGLWLKEPAEVGAEAPVLRDDGGFSAVKMRMGRAHLRDDIAAAEAVRKALGDDTALMVDFNQGLSMAEALERCHALDDFGFAWIEEPILYTNYEGCAQLAAELKTPIQIGENFYGPTDLARAIAMKACDYVMPDAMRIGGVTGWLRAAALAGPAGVPMSTHLYPEVSAHLLRVTPTAHWLEWADWSDPVLKEPYTVKNGMVEIPERPGFGLDWNEDAVKRLLV